jgi:hypothetical protein
VLCTSPTILEAEVLWSGLEFVMMVALKEKRGTLISAIPKYARGIDGCTTQTFPGATLARRPFH